MNSIQNLIVNKNNATNKELQFAKNQVMRSGDISSTNEAHKVIAQNSALTYKAQVENNQMAELLAEKMTEQNILLNRKMKDDAKKDSDRSDYYKFPKQMISKGTN